MENKKQAIEIADIFRDYKHDFLSHHTICAVQQKALEDIIPRSRGYLSVRWSLEQEKVI